MISIKNTMRNVFSIFLIVMFISCEDDMTDNKLEGYEDIPTNLNLTYSLDNESSGYTVMALVLFKKYSKPMFAFKPFLFLSYNLFSIRVLLILLI